LILIAQTRSYPVIHDKRLDRSPSKVVDSRDARHPESVATKPY